MILLLFAGLAAIPSHVPAAAALRCPPVPVTFARSDARAPGLTRAPGLKRLGDLPPAAHFLAVERQFGGCREPAVVRTGIGR
jgi:hypothetical protein